MGRNCASAPSSARSTGSRWRSAITVTTPDILVTAADGLPAGKRKHDVVGRV